MAEVKIPSKNEVVSTITSAKPSERTPVQISGTFTKTKKSFGRRLADAFIGKDVGNVGEYILFTATIPVLKRIICDIGRDLPQMILFGRTTGPTYGQSSNVYPYNRVTVSSYQQPKVNMYGQPVQQAVNSVMFDDISSPDAGALETLREEMIEHIRTYGKISIATVNEMIRAPISPTDNNWGWTSLANSDIRQTRDGYTLVMPKAISLV